MAEISIRRENEDNEIEFNDDLDFEPIDNVNINRDEKVYNFFSDKKSKPTISKPNKEVPFDDIDLLTNKKKTPSRPHSVYDDTYSIHSGKDSEIQVNLDNDFPDDNFDNDVHDFEDKHKDKNKDMFGNNENNFYEEQETPKTYAEILEEKQDYLFKINRLSKSGVQTTRKLTLASSIEDIKYEFNRMKRERDVEKSVKFSRKALLACVSGLEFVNGKFDPFEVQLDGWSENIMENIDDYDEVFEELHDKYKGRGKMAPEVRLLMMVGGSGFMFHLTNSLMKTAMPSVNDILRQNPDLANNIQNAAFSSMNNRNDPVMNMIKGGMNMKNNSRNNRKSQRDNVKEMRGPTGVDDILNKLHNDNLETMSNGSISGNENDMDINFPIKKKGRRKNNRRELDMGF